jgi:hypothetical protein
LLLFDDENTIAAARTSCMAFGFALMNDLAQ